MRTASKTTGYGHTREIETNGHWIQKPNKDKRTKQKAISLNRETKRKKMIINHLHKHTMMARKESRDLLKEAETN